MSAPVRHALAAPPDLLALSARHPDHYPYLLDSAARGPLGTHSLLLRRASEPVALVLDRDRKLSGEPGANGFLDALAQAFERVRQPHSGATAAPPFVGGWFLYLGYELAAEIEPVLDLPGAPDEWPVAFADRCTGAVIVDHRDGRAELVAEDPDTLERMRAELAGADSGPGVGTAVPRLVEWQSEAGDRFERNVERILEYLAAGDVFQVNVSRRWNGHFDASPAPHDLYAALRRANPAPFAALALWNGAALMSSSPERLVEVRGRQVQTRPIAGTRPRGDSAASDAALLEELIAHPKERAEHIMLIDLERNDLGRVCETGSVEVSELMVVESYAHVHHIVSNVRGRLRADAGPADVIRAVFPGGTITGCPKVRCMQIIAELEGQGRGFYTGALGYLGRDGQMDLNILIRSMMLRGTDIGFRTGAGIVADSRPRHELHETEAKARGLLLALGVADA
ncbi:MAG: aminodeoxychorismate synthase component I [Xanthomonadales bacterium]|nr:aminodeoxychorismate synthase component I [Xanthomonadales bacterium]